MRDKLRDKLIEIFKNIEYTPFPDMTMKSNLGNQFTDYALNCIVNELIENGVIVPPCKVGDTVWVMFYRWGKYEIESRKILSVQFYHSGAIQYHCKDGCFYQSEIGKTVFLAREEAEQVLKRSEAK